MAQNGELRRLLEKKLNIKQAQLYHIAQGIANSLSISTGDAILVLAAKNQINLHKHGGNLPAGKLEQIRGLSPIRARRCTAVSPCSPQQWEWQESGTTEASLQSEVREG